MDFMWAADGAAHAGAAKRRRERRLRAYLRYARMSVAMALAEATHHTAPRSQKTARARGKERDEMNFAVGLTTPPPEAASTMYCRMDDDRDVFAARPTPLVEVRLQMGYQRHSGSGFELVLDVTVPQIGS